jgi:hypothetical protein
MALDLVLRHPVTNDVISSSDIYVEEAVLHRFPHGGSKEAQVRIYINSLSLAYFRANAEVRHDGVTRFKGMIVKGHNPRTLAKGELVLAGFKKRFYEREINTPIVFEADVGAQVRQVLGEALNRPTGFTYTSGLILDFTFELGDRYTSSSESVGAFLDAMSKALPAFQVPATTGEVDDLRPFFPEIDDYALGQFVPGAVWDVTAAGVFYFKRPLEVLELTEGPRVIVTPLAELEAEEIIQTVVWELGISTFQGHGLKGDIYDFFDVVASNPVDPADAGFTWNLEENSRQSQEPAKHISRGPLYSTYGGGFKAVAIDPSLGCLKVEPTSEWDIGFSDGAYSAATLPSEGPHTLNPNEKGFLSLSTFFLPVDSTLTSHPKALGFNIKSTANFTWVIYPWVQTQDATSLTKPLLEGKYRDYPSGVFEVVGGGGGEVTSPLSSVDNYVGEKIDQSGDGAFIFFSQKKIRDESLGNPNTLFRLDITFDIGAGLTSSLEYIWLLEANTVLLDRVAHAYYTRPDTNPMTIRCLDLQDPHPVIELTRASGGAPEVLYPSLYSDIFRKDIYAETHITIGTPDNPDELALRQLIEDLNNAKEDKDL